jgi:hypothetical protein
VLADWVREVERHHESAGSTVRASRSAADVSVRELLTSLTVPQLWAASASVLALLAVVATVAFRLGVAST